MRRTSRGSMSNTLAISSMCCSYATHACAAPKPRNADVNVLFVATAMAFTVTLFTLYGPTADEDAYNKTYGDKYTYAPESATRFTCDARMRPLRVTPVLCVMVNG